MNIIRKNQIFKSHSLLVFLITFTGFSILTSYYIYQYEETKNDTNSSFLNLIAGDEPSYLQITSDIIYHHSVFVEDHFNGQFKEKPDDPYMNWPKYYEDPHHWTANKMPNGHYVSVLGPGLSYLLVPSYFLGGIYGVLFTMNVFTSLTSTILYKITSRLTTQKIGLITALLFSFDTIIFNNADKIFADYLMMFFIITITYVIFQRSDNKTLLFLSGAMLGYGALLKMIFASVDLVFIPIIIIFYFKKKISLGNFLIFISGFIIFSLCILLNNLYSYGDILGGNYNSDLVYSIFHTTSPNGTPTTFIHLGEDQRWNSLEEIFFGRDHGIFILSPILLLSFFGFGALYRNNRFLFYSVLCISAVIISVYLWLLPFVPVEGNGPEFRYFIVVVPLLFIPLSLGIDTFKKKRWYNGFSITLTILSGTIAITMASLGRFTNANHSTVKLKVVHTAYLGLDYIFPALGSTVSHYGGTPIYFLMHHPLTEINAFFLACILGLISLLTIYSFRYFKHGNSVQTKN